MDLWNELKAHLKVGIEVEVSDPSDARSNTVVKFTITNEAELPTPGAPTVRFEDVGLHTGFSEPSRSVRLGSLGPGQSCEHEIQCNANQLLELVYYVDANVSPSAFFNVSNNPSHVASDGLLSSKAYLQMFESIDIHRWKRVLRASPVSPANVTEEIDWAKNTQRQLAKFKGMVAKTDLLSVEEHQQHMNNYLEQVSEGLGAFLQRVNAGDEAQIEMGKKRLETFVEASSTRADEATQELRELHTSSKEEPRFY